MSSPNSLLYRTPKRRAALAARTMLRSTVRLEELSSDASNTDVGDSFCRHYRVRHDSVSGNDTRAHLCRIDNITETGYGRYSSAPIELDVSPDSQRTFTPPSSSSSSPSQPSSSITSSTSSVLLGLFDGYAADEDDTNSVSLGSVLLPPRSVSSSPSDTTSTFYGSPSTSPHGSTIHSNVAPSTASTASTSSLPSSFYDDDTMNPHVAAFSPASSPSRTPLRGDTQIDALDQHRVLFDERIVSFTSHKKPAYFCIHPTDSFSFSNLLHRKLCLPSSGYGMLWSTLLVRVCVGCHGTKLPRRKTSSALIKLMKFLSKSLRLQIASFANKRNFSRYLQKLSSI